MLSSQILHLGIGGNEAPFLHNSTSFLITTDLHSSLIFTMTREVEGDPRKAKSQCRM